MAFLKFNKSELVNLEYSLKREIILANKTGAYCNTSLVTCNTRRYHGLLAVPVDNFGGGKYMLLSSVDESIVVGGKQFNLGIHCYGDIYEPRGHKYIIDFDADPVPEIIYKVGDIMFSKTILMVPDNDQVLIKYTLMEAPQKALLKLKPFLAFRNVHSLTHQNGEANTEGKDIAGGVAYRLYEGFPDLNLQMSAKASFRKMPYWYNGITYSDEYRRGFDCMDEYVTECLLGCKSGSEEAVKIEDAVRRAAHTALSMIRKEQIEPQSVMAFHVFARTTKVFYRLGVSIALRRLGYHYVKVRIDSSAPES